MVAKFLEKNPNMKKCDIVAHFKKHQVPTTTIYRLIDRLAERGDLNHAGKGRRAIKMTSAMKDHLIKAAKNKIGISQRFMARKFGISRTYVRKILFEGGVKYTKRQKAPLVTEKQKTAQKARIRTLSRNSFKKSCPSEVVMDDESYFTFTGSNMPGNAGFYAEAGSDVPPHIKYRPEAKYPKKVMVWAAISPRGVSRPVIISSKESVGGAVYRERCIRRGLLPFLEEKYPDHDMIFWPDLASAHYARETLSLLREEGVPVVPREENPPARHNSDPSKIFGA